MRRCDRARRGTPSRARRAARRGRPARAGRRRARRARDRRRPRSPRSGRPRSTRWPRACGRGRLARIPPGGAGLRPPRRASRSNSVSNVPSVPASRPPCRSSSSRSTRSTSARCGTISHGSRSSPRRNGRGGSRPFPHAPGRRRATGSPGKRSPPPSAASASGTPESSRSAGVRRRSRQASDFGLRPRLATAEPGIPPAQESHRSAAFAPRRASVNVTRMTAPLPSSTSEPHLSQTSTVFLATIPPSCGNRLCDFRR